jgi:S1-C subfamily serine protease
MVDMSASEFDPREVVGAVLRADEAGILHERLGTGSIIGDGTIVLTANHVVANRPGTLDGIGLTHSVIG